MIWTFPVLAGRAIANKYHYYLWRLGIDYIRSILLRRLLKS